MKQKKGRHKPKELKKALYNVETLYKAGSSVTKYFDDCFSIVSEAKHALFHEEGIKISFPKKMLQRLPTALAQVKAGSTSENLLNKTC